MLLIETYVWTEQGTIQAGFPFSPRNLFHYLKQHPRGVHYLQSVGIVCAQNWPREAPHPAREGPKPQRGMADTSLFFFYL